MCFYDVAHRPQAECRLRHIGGRRLAQEQYFAFGAELTNSSSHFNPADGGKTDVKHDQVRFQLFGFANRFEPVSGLSDNPHILHFTES